MKVIKQTVSVLLFDLGAILQVAGTPKRDRPALRYMLRHERRELLRCWKQGSTASRLDALTQLWFVAFWIFAFALCAWVVGKMVI